MKYQYKDDFSFSKTIAGRTHDFKAGIAFINEPTLGGDFTSGTTGQYSMAAGPAGGPPWVVTDITKYGGFSGDSTPSKQYSAYFQDDWRVTPNLTLNLGLRYDYYDALTLDQSSNPIWQMLSTQTTYSYPELLAFRNGGGRVLKNDKNDWAPRLGFSWDINGDGLGDLLLGAPSNIEGGGINGDTQTEAGQIYLVLGKTSGWKINTSLSSVDASFIGQVNDHAGMYVSALGDVNGDGLDDFIAGISSFSGHYQYEGAAYLFFGKKADCNEEGPQSKRDLEDYARLWINVQGLVEMFKDEYESPGPTASTPPSTKNSGVTRRNTSFRSRWCRKFAN